MRLLQTLIFVCSVSILIAQEGTFKLAAVKYNGGGDWYANPTALVNLIEFCNSKLDMNIYEKPDEVDVGSKDVFNYPFLHLTGHGNVVFNSSEAENLRNFLIAGGFLHISDNYGLDEFIRPQMKKVFPELDFIEIPFDHDIYHQSYNFNKGLPKIHEHNAGYPQGFGLIFKGRLVCFYDYECDLGDGWEDQEVHNDSEPTRQKALQMGANILEYALMGSFD